MKNLKTGTVWHHIDKTDIDPQGHARITAVRNGVVFLRFDYNGTEIAVGEPVFRGRYMQIGDLQPEVSPLDGLRDQIWRLQRALKNAAFSAGQIEHAAQAALEKMK